VPHPDIEMPQVVEEAPAQEPLVFHGETVLPGSAMASAAPQPPPLIGKVFIFTFVKVNVLIFFLFSDKNVRADGAQDARVGDGAEAVQQPQVRLVPLRRLVHGLRHWTHFHLPLLASPGLKNSQKIEIFLTMELFIL
jgi:hypothetical protein